MNQKVNTTKDLKNKITLETRANKLNNYTDVKITALK